MRAAVFLRSGRTTTLLASAIGLTMFAGAMIVAFERPVPIFAALLLITAGLAVIRFPIVALLFLLFAAPFHYAIFTALQNKAHVATGPLLYWKEGLLLALFVRAVIERLFVDLKFPLGDPGDGLLLFYIFAFLVIAIASPARSTVWPAFDRYVEGPILLLTIVFLRPTRKQLWWCLGAVVACAAVMGGAAIYERFFARYSFHEWYGAGIGESKAPFLVGKNGYRAGSFIYDPLILGFFLAGSVGLTATLAAFRSRWRAAMLLAVAASGGGLIAAGTRSGFLGGSVALLVALLLAIRDPAIRLAVVGIAIVVGGSLWLYYYAAGSQFLVRPESDTAHQERVERGFDLLQAQPFGYGLGTTDRFSSQEGFGAGQLGFTENTYLATALESGMQGLVLYLVALFGTAMRLRAVRRRALRAGDVAGTALAVGGLAAMAGIVVSGLFLGVHEQVVEEMLWGPAGIAIAWALASGRSDTDGAPSGQPEYEARPA